MDITYKSELRFSGICITQNLKWDPQVQTPSSNLSKESHIIKSLKEIMSPYMIRNIYYTNFQSCLTYSIILLGRDNESKNKWSFE
jgi:hypothetical protein